MKILRQIVMLAAIVIMGMGMYQLYQMQLGSVSFLILSIVFFILGFRMLSKRK
jgi:membrane protein implicated in regulation of membrane protease activity